MPRELVDTVIDVLEVSANSFRTIRTMGRLPETKAVRIIGDIVAVASIILPSIEGQIRRLREMKETGVELTPEEWHDLQLSVTANETELLNLLKESDPS